MCDFANANHYEKKMQLGRAKIIIVDDRSEVKMMQMYWDFRQLNLFPRAFSNLGSKSQRDLKLIGRGGLMRFVKIAKIVGQCFCFLLLM